MHPNVFLKTFWRMQLKPQIFVAMSFHGNYAPRFQRVIEPAIKNILLDGVPFTAYRVDNSKTGDSILTDIMDGIAHSRLVLADVSTMARDPKTGYAYRNGNVMYEVGLALACRLPSDVLLIRDDQDKDFLFDVSTIPHLTINFSNIPSAMSILCQKLLERLKEQNFALDARIQTALASLNHEEWAELKVLADYHPSVVFASNPSILGTQTIARLLDKQIVKLAGYFTDSSRTGYCLTEFGRVLAEHLKHTPLRQLQKDFEISFTPKQEEPKQEGPEPPTESQSTPGQEEPEPTDRGHEH